MTQQLGSGQPSPRIRGILVENQHEVVMVLAFFLVPILFFRWPVYRIPLVLHVRFSPSPLISGRTRRVTWQVPKRLSSAPWRYFGTFCVCTSAELAQPVALQGSFPNLWVVLARSVELSLSPPYLESEGFLFL